MQKEFDINSRFQLSDGTSIPVFGMGFYRTGSKEVKNIVKWAYKEGYRLFDTAQIYQNEAAIGEAMSELKVPRGEIYLTTKVWNANQTRTRDSIKESLKKLKVQSVDLILLHWPVKESRLKAWEELIKLRDKGFTKSIGVSNYMIKHLEELKEHGYEMPTVNQVEFSPYLQHKELREYCNKEKIVFEGYSPLTKGKRLNDQRLIAIAKKYNKTPAQILIRWVLQSKAVAIPKTSKQERIKENADVFDFSLNDVDLKEMESWEEGLVTGWDPRSQE